MPHRYKTSTSLPRLLESINSVLRSKLIPYEGLDAIAGTTLSFSAPADTCVFSDGEEPATLTSATETYSFLDGQTLVLSVNGGGDQTATFNATAASLTGSGLSIVDLTGDTLLIDMNNTGGQTINFAGTESTAEDARDTINGQLTGGVADVVGGQIRITSSISGTNSEVDITGGTALTELGLSVATDTGTGDFADISVATAAEVVTVLTADITGATASVVSSAVQLVTAEEGSDASIQVTGGTGASNLGFTVGQAVRGTATIGGRLSVKTMLTELNAALNDSNIVVRAEYETGAGAQGFYLIFELTTGGTLTMTDDATANLLGFSAAAGNNSATQVAQANIEAIGENPGGYFCVYFE